MIVKLIRHSFPDRPDWIVISENVPLGTRYEVMAYDRDFTIVNNLTHERRDIEVYLLSGRGDNGWLPTICFEMVKES